MAMNEVFFNNNITKGSDMNNKNLLLFKFECLTVVRAEINKLAIKVFFY